MRCTYLIKLNVRSSRSFGALRDEFSLIPEVKHEFYYIKQ